MSVPQLHPGKVIDVYRPGDKNVISADTNAQALLGMWDGHTLTVNVHPKLGAKIRAGDFVLVDYYPVKGFGTPFPKIQVTKILRGPKARKIVEEYKSYMTKIRKSKSPTPSGQVNERYIG